MPVLTHPTEWPEAAKRGLTRKVGPLPVWAWGAIIVGTVFVVSRMGKGGGSKKSTTLNTLLPGGGGGTYAGGGGGGGGGGATPPASAGHTVNPGGTSGPGLGAVVPSDNLVEIGEFEVPRDFGSLQNIPGMASVSAGTQEYWGQKLAGNYANVGTPDPAQFLAQYLEIAKTGSFLPDEGSSTRLPISQADLDAGLAFAQQYAADAGVTQDQLLAAQKQVQTQYAGRL